MANTQAQFGFRHIGFLSGGAPDYQLTTAAIQSTYATKIFFGDPVCYSTGTNYLIPATASTSTSGTAIVGIFQGCLYTPAGGVPTPSPWWPGTTQSADATAYIISAPNAKFLVAALNTAIPATAIGRNVGFSTGAGGTTVGGGFSTYTIDQATINTTITQGYFRILSLYPGVGNGSDPTTAYNWAVVGFNPNCTAVIG